MTDEVTRSNSIYEIGKGIVRPEWNEREAVSEDDVEAGLSAYVPGGASVYCWLPMTDGHTIHQTAREVMRSAIAAVDKRRSMTPEPAQPAESPEVRAMIDPTGFAWPTDDQWKAQSEAETQAILRRHREHMLAFAATTARPTERGAVEALLDALGRAASDMQNTPRHNRDGVCDLHIQESRERIRTAMLLNIPVTGWGVDAGFADRHTIAKIINPSAFPSVGCTVLSEKLGELADELGIGSPATKALAKADAILALTPPVTVAATDQAGEVERAAVAVAKVLGIDLHEQCAAEGEGSCDSDTCPGALTEDHDAEEHRERIYRMARASLATQTATGRTMGGEDGLTGEEAWDILLNVDDRTSPEEYPDMCLITREELMDFMSRAALQNGGG